MAKLVLSIQEIGEPQAEGRAGVVRFKDDQGNTVLEIKSGAALVEVSDPDGVVFTMDAAGNVEV